MSLTINATTPDGIVLAADSRQSFRNKKGQARVGSDSAIKVIQLGSKMGVTLAGPAFLPENDILKNVSKFVEDYKNKNDIDSMGVEEVAHGFKKFFEKKYLYEKRLESLPKQIKAQLQAEGFELLELKKKKGHIKFTYRDREGNIRKGRGGVDVLSLMVAGYDKDGSHKTFISYVPGVVSEKRNSKIKGKEYGAAWTGQIDVVARVVLGRDPRTAELLMQKGVVRPELSSKQIIQILMGLEYSISWGTMTLQDAADFCRLMIETTSAIQRFSDGIIMNPGNIPGVGGPIDIAVITPEKGFVWVSRKKLQVGENVIDLNKIDDLTKTKIPGLKKTTRNRKK